MTLQRTLSFIKEKFILLTLLSLIFEHYGPMNTFGQIKELYVQYKNNTTSGYYPYPAQKIRPLYLVCTLFWHHQLQLLCSPWLASKPELLTHPISSGAPQRPFPAPG